jgi:hypothetical protein
MAPRVCVPTTPRSRNAPQCYLFTCTQSIGFNGGSRCKSGVCAHGTRRFEISARSGKGCSFILAAAASSTCTRSAAHFAPRPCSTSASACTGVSARIAVWREEGGAQGGPGKGWARLRQLQVMLEAACASSWRVALSELRALIMMKQQTRDDGVACMRQCAGQEISNRRRRGCRWQHIRHRL